MTGKQIYIETEKDLHYKVVDCVRKNFPEMILVPGLGELQDTISKRCDAYNKGYVGGQPDLLIMNSTGIFSGFALELKSPTGKWKLTTKQENYIDKLTELKYKTLVSDDYDEIVIELTNYYREMFKETEHRCPHCCKIFKFQKALKKHLRTKHGK